MITLDSPIVGYVEVIDGVLTPPDAKRPDERVAYLKELVRLCKLVDFDWRILYAQAWHETAGFTSRWWTERLNPAGIGITGDPAQNAASHTWANGTDAARAHVVHLALYVFGETVTWSPAVASALDDWTNFDPRLQAVSDAGFAGTVRFLRDLGNGRWATDPNYAEKIAARANEIFEDPQGETPMPTKPQILDLMRDYARYGISQEDAATVRGYRFENRNGAKPTFIVLHIQAGTTRSSLDWWANGYVNGQKVTASSTVMIQKDGSILQVIPEQHGPWTNGDDAHPTPAGERLVNLPGNSNLHTLSIEAEGMHGGDTTAVQLDAIEWQVRDWMARWDIPIENVIRHADINSVSRPNCPGAYYRIIMQRLKSGGGSGPVYAQPDPVPWKRGDVGLTTLGSAKALKITAELTAKRDTQPRKYASGKSERTGPEIKTGSKVVVIGSLVVPPEPGKVKPTYWYVREDGSRLGASALTPKLPFA